MNISLFNKTLNQLKGLKQSSFGVGRSLNGTISITRSFHETNYDIAIVGGGIVGLATAQELQQRNQNLKCIVLEKEDQLAYHQTGHNSGVIHAGIYYEPGSLKALLCWKGLKMMYNYCDEHNIPCKRVGKLIVALDDSQVASLQRLYDRGRSNGVEGLTLVTKDEIKQIEPYCEGVAGIFSPNTGIVDYARVARHYAKRFQSMGGMVASNYEVQDIKYRTDIKSVGVEITGKSQPPIKSRYVITCGGLQSDRIAKMTGCSSDPKIVPFRGDYLVLKPEKSHMVTTNIYPVPDQKFSFLGVHFTPRMDGSIWLGPNSILAFKREGYGLTDFNTKDFLESIAYSGFRNLLKTNWKFAARELYNGFVISKTVESAKKFIPSLTVDDFVRGPSGVRAQALHTNGSLENDFIFDTGRGAIGNHCLHVRNAPSPAATSSLAIAEMIVDKVEENWSDLKK
ncbi:L-2-hydroxyglutarate dehydrogenase, mitochondrial-like [Clytia hemisphaerica]|uniref:L-2-hydroxyglutarate dehydrogenase, mitochondrial n=1 Tax=Clytia hemisphaerica TaxID=252671 RepID=A0A7M5V2B2_9CNID